MDDLVHVANKDHDREACFRIRHEVFVEEQNVPVEVERDEYDESAIHIIMKSYGRPVGTARIVMKDDGKTAKIGRVAVLKSERGRGLGKMLINFAEDFAAKAENFVLDAQTDAMSFYSKLGYEGRGGEFVDAGILHRHMIKAKRNPLATYEPS